MAIKNIWEQVWTHMYTLLCLTTESESSEEADGEFVTSSLSQYLKTVILSMTITVSYSWQGDRGGVSVVNRH